MLRIIAGKARSGKTSLINAEIKDAVSKRQGGRFLLVPEQYSHEAERELCRICGDSLSLYAEVLSFTGLARKITAELGGIAVSYLDEGGRILCMALALKMIGGKLHVFQSAVSKPELQTMLISALEALKLSCISSADLLEAASRSRGDLANKLSDLAAVTEAYDAVLGSSRVDPADRLSVLAENLEKSTLIRSSTVYVDGFIDFTKAELAVLTAVMKCGAPLTVCLTYDEAERNNEVFALSRSSAGKLISIAKKLGVPFEIRNMENDETRADSLKFFADRFFSYTGREMSSDGRIELIRAENISSECELAAAKILEAVRENNYRWRDIAVAVRGFDDYAALLESTFEEYGIPLFAARKSDLKNRPIPAMIADVYDIVNHGWRTDDLISYMSCGLTGLTREECDLLSGYLYLWNPDERSWKRKSPWRQSPDGPGEQPDEKAEERLARINELRAAIAFPLLRFEEAGRAARTASEHATALTDFFEDLKLPEILEARARQLRDSGRWSDAEEYRQLWEIIVSAIEQVYHVLGDSSMGSDEFARLLLQTVSQYQVGTIPVTLDAVTAGDFDRMRRRNIKVLLILGADDMHVPALSQSPGLFSEEELRLLRQTGTELGEDPDLEMWREYTLIYSCLSLPTDRLILTCPMTDAEGNEARPSILFTRAQKIFSLQPVVLSREEAETSALRPAFRLAAAGDSDLARAAAAFFREREPEKLRSVIEASRKVRNPLSAGSVRKLYGDRLNINASRAEKFFSCRYAFFCDHGLRIRPYRQAEFSPSEYGTFVHYVLQHTVEAVMETGGFRSTDDDAVRAIAEQVIREYEKSALNDFAEKSERYVYLFRRAEDDALRTVLDTAGELRRTDFVPLAFELNFGDGSLFPAIRLNPDQDTLKITGIADRIDGWQHDGTVYVRIVDYKTGEKKFSFSDIWYGMSLQLVLYLFALENDEQATKKALHLPEDLKLSPAGAIYHHARSRFVNTEAAPDDETIEKERKKDLKRSGIVLDGHGVPQAWEVTPDKLYSPLKYNKDGVPGGDYLLSPEQSRLLLGYVRSLLAKMADEVKSGDIHANPWSRSGQETACLRCVHRDVCGFEEGENNEHARIQPELKNDEVWEKICGEEKADV